MDHSDGASQAKADNPVEPAYRELGDTLSRIRRAAGLTQREVADRAGVGRPTLANIEKGRQRVLYHQLLDIADALGTDPRELLPPPAATSPALDRLDDLQSPADVIDWVRRGLARGGGHDRGDEG
ncbi:helix-turn-helix domain-containing protein [Micromonospora sp. WMMC264]|uniref:helix-turn-helix domain-containing protein n=1 Tax=Micromonospora sp. WMMC264 TaxID=3015158 RepID=UPI00248AF10D|nr:helix-turn-helix domain-containing protein [Micromonospora sp. WMMC264]WBB84709.1 helix-turn-helix domain-containing protein [Micromonospora sp. WMMC264]